MCAKTTIIIYLKLKTLEADKALTTSNTATGARVNAAQEL